MLELVNYVDGARRPSTSSRWLDVWEPAAGQVHGRVPQSDEADLDTALESARHALSAWRDLPASERARWLNRVANLVERDLEEFACAESRDTGKPVAPRAPSTFRVPAYMRAGARPYYVL